MGWSVCVCGGGGGVEPVCGGGGGGVEPVCVGGGGTCVWGWGVGE